MDGKVGRINPRDNIKNEEKDAPQQEGKEVLDKKEMEVDNKGRVREQWNRGRKGKEGNVDWGPKPRYSFWPKQDSGQGECTIRLGQAPDTTQDQYNRLREKRKEAFKEKKERN